MSLPRFPVSADDVPALLLRWVQTKLPKDLCAMLTRIHVLASWLELCFDFEVTSHQFGQVLAYCCILLLRIAVSFAVPAALLANVRCHLMESINLAALSTATGVPFSVPYSLRNGGVVSIAEASVTAALPFIFV